jgi:hypothetical protein
MDGDLLPLLLLSAGAASPSAGGSRTEDLLPLLLLGGNGLGTDTDGSSEGPIFAPVLADQIKRYRGRRVKLVLGTSTLYPGGQLVIATIREVLDDYVVIDEIEVNGVPVFDPSFLLLSTSQILALEPISFRKFLLEFLWRLHAFRRRSTTSTGTRA